MAATYNIAIQQGADFSDKITLTDSSSNPINLTGATVTSVIRRGPSTAGYAILGSFTITISAPTTGAISRFMAGSVTANLPIPFGTGVSFLHDVKVVTSTGTIFYPVTGSVTINGASTV